MTRRSNDALAVSCPTCKQLPLSQCISLVTGLAKRWPHPARRRYYLEQKDHP